MCEGVDVIRAKLHVEGRYPFSVQMIRQTDVCGDLHLVGIGERYFLVHRFSLSEAVRPNCVLNERRVFQDRGREWIVPHDASDFRVAFNPSVLAVGVHYDADMSWVDNRASASRGKCGTTK